MQRLKSDLRMDEITKSLEILREHGKFFSDFPKRVLNKFAEHCKFIAFKPKQQLTKRNEPVDFFGIILKGTAIVTIQNQAVSTLKEGDAIGHFSLLNLPGCEIQQFDIYAKDEGYMALIRKDDIRIIFKRDPEFAQILTQMASILSLNTISHQYLQTSYNSKSETEPLEASGKKLIQMLDNLALTPDEIQLMLNAKKQQPINLKMCFRQFWLQLDQKEKRLLTQNATLIEVDSEKFITKANQSGNCFFIVINGEAVEFQKNKPGISYKPGQTIGLMNFLTQQSFENNIIAKLKTQLLRVTWANLSDMFQQPLSACKIVETLVKWEAFKIKEYYENSFPDQKQKLQNAVENLFEELKLINKPLSKKEQMSIPQLMGNFFEVNLSQNIEKKQTLEQSMSAPLYVLDVYKDLLAKRGFQSTELKDRKDPMLITGMSILLREKCEQQQLEAKEKRIEQKKRKGSEEEFVVEKELDAFEQLNNDFYELKSELEKSNEYISLLEEQVTTLREKCKENKEERERLHQQVKKYEMHRELLKLELGNDNSLTSNILKTTRFTMHDIYKFQSQEMKKFSSTVKVAERLMNHKQ